MARSETASTQSERLSEGKGAERRRRASSGGGGFGVRLRGGMDVAHRLPDTKFLFLR